MAFFSKIGIIGAGISGIAAAKQLSTYDPTVFESSNSLGGVWKHCSFRTTKLQTPRCDFEFSDFPWTERDNSSFPSSQEVLDYLYSYADKFDLLKFVKFNYKVVEIKFVGDPEIYGNVGSFISTGKPVWEVAVRNNQTEIIERYAFEFLVVCTGKFGDQPNIPVFYHENKGPEVFKGKVMHSIDYSKLDQEATIELLKDKKVVVVGYKKSAIDLAVECAEANQGLQGQCTTMIIRTLHWTVPHLFIWGIPLHWFYSTRFSQFFHERPNEGLLKRIFCRFSSPLRRLRSMIIESYLTWKLPLEKYDLKPNHPFEEDYGSCQMATLPPTFFTHAEEGKIKFKRASKWWFWEGGVEFEDSTKLEADVVLLCTGFDGKEKVKAILPEPYRSNLESPGFMPLYRGTVHLYIPNMAFVGYVGSMANLHTSEIKCIWLARLLGGQFKLPCAEKMLEQIIREREIMGKTSRFFGTSCISTFSINHNDEICEEMGWSSWRKKNWFSEMFGTYCSHDYEH